MVYSLLDSSSLNSVVDFPHQEQILDLIESTLFLPDGLKASMSFSIPGDFFVGSVMTDPP